MKSFTETAFLSGSSSVYLRVLARLTGSVCWLALRFVRGLVSARGGKRVLTKITISIVH